MGENRLANMGKSEGQHVKILLALKDRANLTLLLVREKSGNFDFSSLWEPCSLQVSVKSLSNLSSPTLCFEI